ncbi:MAG: RNA-directed DNA polymerase [Phycisphaeraceae bacterium]|nr:RNA-directed DNA polymerase [Phycisphaeraceae bacterium]
MGKRAAPRPATEQSVLEMTAAQAKRFFLKPESYCNIDFPPYLRFDRLLSAVSNAMGTADLKSMHKCSPRECEEVNCALLSNKDGRHAWRPFQLIHPALYVSLVGHITKPAHWQAIRRRFAEFQAPTNFKCLSIPLRSGSKRKDKAAQILQWWQGIEQGSIELSLDYTHAFHADIADCYAAIYTHSIAWALHSRPVAKAKRTDKALIGNIIDGHIQDMRHGQTNGIPQGSVLMDFVAETVLGYADLELSGRLAAAKITEYRILRYRDDYRIFVNNPQVGEAILKALTEVMIGLGLKLNTSKTTGSQSVVRSSLKPDKLAWLRSRQGDPDPQKHLLAIHAHGADHPNAGSLVVALSRFHERISRSKRIRSADALIAIVVDIAYTSPRTFPVCAAIVSRLLPELKPAKRRLEVIRKIGQKLAQLPNTGHMEVWLQRISHPYEPEIEFSEPMCQLVRGSSVNLWNSDWIGGAKLKAAINPELVVDRRRLKVIKPIVRPAEIRVFSYERY